MFVVGGIQAALFLGGWHDPLGLIGYYYAKFMQNPSAHFTGLLVLNGVGVVMFTTKCMGIIFVQMWLRWTLPRPRIDQVLYACIKVLLPLACVLLLAASLWQLLVSERPGVPWFDYQPFSIAAWKGHWGAMTIQAILALVGVAAFSTTVLFVIYSFATGRNLKQRLTEPANIEMA
jgi:cytochrome bd-type quinol oxidase subunit 1